MTRRYEMVGEIRQEYRRFNTSGTELMVRLNPATLPGGNPVDYFLASVNDLFEHALQDMGDADMVGIAIHSEVNQSDRPIGISFRRRDQLSGDVIRSVFEVTKSNSRFNALDTLTVVLYSVKMPVGFGRQSSKTKGRHLSVMAHLKKSTDRVKTEKNCLAHALIIAIAKLSNDPNYKAYIQGRKIYPKDSQLLVTTGISLDNGEGIPELERFRTIFGNIRSLCIRG